MGDAVESTEVGVPIKMAEAGGQADKKVQIEVGVRTTPSRREEQRRKTLAVLGEGKQHLLTSVRSADCGSIVHTSITLLEYSTAPSLFSSRAHWSCSAVEKESRGTHLLLHMSCIHDLRARLGVLCYVLLT